MYDAVIIGASVGGLYTGYMLAQTGRSVCIVDRRKEIGVPVRCGEATGNRLELARFVPIDERWIAGDIKGLAIHVNDSFSMQREIEQTGVILHREIFEKHCASLAQSSGAKILLSTIVSGLTQGNTGSKGILLENGSSISGKIIIGADGCESKIGRWAGITKPLLPEDSFPSIQYRVHSDFCNDGFLHFFIGAGLIPGGYIWIFPKSKTHISIGAGLYGCPGQSEKKAKHYLDDFIEKKLGETTKEDPITGCVPLAVCPKSLYNGSVVVVGDSARQCNPLTAGGIMNTLEAADLLARQLIKQKDFSSFSKAFKSYSTAWSGQPRFQQKSFYFLLKIFLICSDNDLIKLIKTASTIFHKPIRRDKPFSWPILPFIRIMITLFPKTISLLVNKRIPK